MKKRLSIAFTGFTVAAIMASTASGQLEFYFGDSRIDEPIDTATFDGFENGSSLAEYREAGLRVHVNHFAFVFTPCGFLDNRNYYPSGGVYDQINITRKDGEDFGIIEMNVGDGWSACVNYMWIQGFLDGDLVQEFDADVPGGSLIGLSGQFDEVRIASYYEAAVRDLHDPFEYNAIALDNVAYTEGGGVSLRVSGSCPGSMTFDASGATPGGAVAYIYAFGAGNVVIPSGPCAGTELGLNATAQLGGTETANAAGEATLTTNVPAAACGRVFVQALDVSSCTPSNVSEI